MRNRPANCQKGCWTGPQFGGSCSMGHQKSMREVSVELAVQSSACSSLAGERTTMLKGVCGKGQEQVPEVRSETIVPRLALCSHLEGWSKYLLIQSFACHTFSSLCQCDERQCNEKLKFRDTWTSANKVHDLEKETLRILRKESRPPSVYSVDGRRR